MTKIEDKLQKIYRRLTTLEVQQNLMNKYLRWFFTIVITLILAMLVIAYRTEIVK